MSKTPTQRTLDALRKQGLAADIAERYLAHARRPDGKKGIHKDLFGVIDVVVLDPARGIGGVQTTGDDFAGHMRKMTGPGAENCVKWLSCPGAWLELWAWRKVVKTRGSKVKVWRPRVHVFKITDFACYDPTK